MARIEKIIQNMIDWENLKQWNPNFIKLMLVVILVLLVFTAVYWWKLRYEVEGIREYGKEKKRDWTWILIALGASLLIKMIFAANYAGHETDMNCFYAWSNMIFENGVGKFYYLDAFTDYPPGYMAILWVIAAIRHLFSIETVSTAGRILIKLVPMLSDVAAGFILYRLAKKKFSEGSSLLIAVTYVLNPIVVLDSSVWGQTDGVFTLFVLLTCYLCMEEKRIPAYFTFIIGALIKPQTLIFAPILIWTIVEQVFIKDFNKQKLIRDLIGGASAIALMFLLAAPFGLGKVIHQYIDTLGSYEYCTINAYNIWALFGKNWADQSGSFLFLQYHQWGTLAIFASVILSGFIFFRLKEDKSKYFLSMCVVVGTMFLFSVRMHERYLFPIVLLLLAAFLVKPTRELFFTYVGFSMVQLLNVGHVLYYFNVYHTTGPQGGIIGMTALMTLALYAYMFFAIRSKSELADLRELPAKRGKKVSRLPYIIHKSAKKEKEEIVRERILFRKPTALPGLAKIDFIVLGAIMLVYSAFALYDLGDMGAPETEWAYHISDEEQDVSKNVISLDLGEDKAVDMIYTFLGNYENRKFRLEMSHDGESYQPVGGSDVLMAAASVFKWNALKAEGTEDKSYNLADGYRYIRLTAQDGESVLKELVILDKNKNILLPVNAGDYPELFDEQEYFDELQTFRSGTYFDEIYHARTAYEMTHDLYNYENTHPPLGKFFISLGVRIFGMNPFGWRIAGVLFGIGMLPFMYAFGRRLFGGNPWASGMLTFLFAFDFMHFTQTRISTIDVYGTFFIIAMFYFMLKYAQTEFYEKPLWKMFIPLGLSAVMMGLGCASKWTGVYAAAGLGVFFFAIMGVRIAEYVKAKKETEGTTNGISHALVIEVFPKRFVFTILFCILFFIIIAGGIYLLSYVPFSDGCEDNVQRFASILNDTERPAGGLYKIVIEFLQEHQNPFTELVGRMVKNADTMFHYHASLKSTHPYSSSWEQWPTMIKPMFYYCNTVANGLKEGISAFGNPLVWWAGIPAFFVMLYRIIRRSDKTAMFLVFAYMVQYLPWILVPRCTFAYHYFPSVPFVAMMVVYCMVLLVRKSPKWLKWMYVYGVAAFVLFLLFYPVLSGQPILDTFARDGLKWLNGWVLVL